MARSYLGAADDLGRFLQIADHIKVKKSIREIADIMRISPQTVSEVISRLENFRGEKLVDRATGSQDTRLSPNGERLLARLKRCLTQPANVTRPARVKLAHSLIQNSFFLSLLNHSRQSTPPGAELPDSSRADFELSTGVVFHDRREIRDLLAGRLDLLLCWAFPQRIAKLTRAAGVTVKEIGPSFPLVLISHREDVVELCARSLKGDPPWVPAQKIHFDEIVKYRCATITQDKQPLIDQLAHHGIYFVGNRHIQTSSFQSVIELVRAQIADVAIVPLIGRDLDVLQLTCELFYKTLPVNIGDDATALRIAAIYRQAVEPPGASKSSHPSKTALASCAEVNRRTRVAESVVGRLEEGLGRMESEEDDPEGRRIAARIVRDGVSLQPLPVNRRFYESLRFGYYLFRPDGTRATETQWYRERIELILTEADEESVFKGRGQITNEGGQTYCIEDVRLVDGAFFVVAKQVSNPRHGRKQCGFVSVFNAKVQLPVMDRLADSTHDEPAIIVGLWNGGGGRNLAAAWATVFSQVMLPPKILNVISRSASMTHTICSPSLVYGVGKID